jgi:hypothetical protein
MKKDGARVMMKPVVSSQMNKGGVHMKKKVNFICPCGDYHGFHLSSGIRHKEVRHERL